jgi:hypothetical protein
LERKRHPLRDGAVVSVPNSAVGNDRSDHAPQDVKGNSEHRRQLAERLPFLKVGVRYVEFAESPIEAGQFTLSERVVAPGRGIQDALDFLQKEGEIGSASLVTALAAAAASRLARR